MIRFLVNIIAALLLGCFGSAATATDLPLPVDELQRTDPVDFGEDILPIFQRNCLACHHGDEPEGGLVLETVSTIGKGGDSGPAIVAGEANASLLLARARGQEEPLMPPEDNSVGAKPLTPGELGLLKLWIDQGAKVGEGRMQSSIAWRPLSKRVQPVYALDVSPDGQFVAIGRANRVVLVDLSTFEETARLVDSSLGTEDIADVDIIHSIAVSPDAKRIATGGYRTVRIWSKTSPLVDRSESPLANAAGLVAVNADESAAAMVNAIGDIEIWDVDNRVRKHTLSGHTTRVTGLVWSDASDRLFSCDQTGLIVAWQASTGQQRSSIDVKTPLTSLAASLDGSVVATIDIDGKARFFRNQHDSALIEYRIGEALDGVTAIAFVEKPTPMAVIARHDGGVILFELTNSQLTRTLDHGVIVDALAVTEDQSRLITGARDGTIRVWNIADGEPVLRITGDPDSRRRLAEASRDVDRQQAAIARLNVQTADSKKRLETEDAALEKATAEHQNAKERHLAESKKREAAVAIVSSIEAKLAKATIAADQATEEIRVATEKLAAEKARTEVLANELATERAGLESADEAVRKAQGESRRAANALRDAEAFQEQVRTRVEQRQAAIAEAQRRLASSEDEVRRLAKLGAETAGIKQTAAQELEAGRKAANDAEKEIAKSETELRRRQQAVDLAARARLRAAAAIPRNETLLEMAARRLNRLERVQTQRQSLMEEPGNAVVSISVSRDGATIATAHRNGAVRTYRARDGLPIAAHRARHDDEAPGVVCLGDWICRFGRRSHPEIWSRHVVWSLERTIGSIEDASTISDRVTALDYRRDGLSIAVGSGPPSRSGHARIFAIDSGELVRDFGEVHRDTVMGLKFSPDGRFLASSAADNTIRLLEIAAGTVARSLEGHTHHVLSIAWLEDGQTLASASADRTVKVWDTTTGQQRRTIQGFPDEVTAVAFAGNSNQIVTACVDGQVRLSDVSNGKSIRSFDASGDYLFTLVVTPDGKQLIGGGQSGAVRVWTLEDGKLTHELK